MPSIAEIFATNSVKSKNNNMEIAALLRVLAQLLDDSEEKDIDSKDEADVETRTRPHFMPYGG